MRVSTSLRKSLLQYLYHEANEIIDAARGEIFIGVFSQRRFNPIFCAFEQMRRHIGKIYSIEGKYVMNINRLDNGWRARKSAAGGGALIDMGYHYIDLLVWYFGVPDSVTARISRANRIGQEYDVEDTANMLFDYCLSDSYEEKTIGNIIISRVYPFKEEKLSVYGTDGYIELQRGLIRRMNSRGEEVERLASKRGWPSAFTDQLEFFAKEIRSGKRCGPTTGHEHLKHIATLEAAYASDRSHTSCNPNTYLAKFTK